MALGGLPRAPPGGGLLPHLPAPLGADRLQGDRIHSFLLGRWATRPCTRAGHLAGHPHDEPGPAKWTTARTGSCSVAAYEVPADLAGDDQRPVAAACRGRYLRRRPSALHQHPGRLPAHPRRCCQAAAVFAEAGAGREPRPAMSATLARASSSAAISSSTQAPGARRSLLVSSRLAGRGRKSR
jgi:hypothetical protein